MAFDATVKWPDTPGFLRLYVEDADEVHGRALEAGATSVTEVTHLFWGDRVGRVRDPYGNLWWIQARVEEVDPAEMERRAGEEEWIERMAYVQVSLDRELETGHARQDGVQRSLHQWSRAGRAHDAAVSASTSGLRMKMIPALFSSTPRLRKEFTAAVTDSRVEATISARS